MPTTPATLVADINSIYNPLLSGLTFDLNLPLELSSVDLIGSVPEFTPVPVPNLPALSLEDLTAGETTLTGSGAFDVLMRAINKHLEAQFKSGNLSAAEKSKIYVAALELALTQGANYLVAANNAAWQGENAKRQAELLEIQKAMVAQESRTKILETITAKMNMTQTQINGHVAQGNLVGIKIKVGDVYHDILQKEAQQALLNEQVDAARAQTKDTLASGATITGLLAAEKVLKTKQASLVDEQIDAARAQTKDTITDGLTSVSGILGSQKALYTQQRESFIHDSMNKAVRVLADGWTTQKTVDEGWTPPGAFLNTYIDPAMREYFKTVGISTT